MSHLVEGIVCRRKDRQSTEIKCRGIKDRCVESNRVVFQGDRAAVMMSRRINLFSAVAGALSAAAVGAAASSSSTARHCC
ncbi:hypothetical protein P171DRAFT_427932 [Karstenula rhodostoma CBS 690.94]|uniref:Uncharacterized protein n=1 Tax=Karstenula rhodostoma CBS 690.94 TaxID=1392251 RepID=A0A9P4PVQ6_9PLEO|nr:hypothetical protein P171DRAFT_427932 [Karstenula rhodostoma CBS 690.94]